jgi:hypothetical protein
MKSLNEILSSNPKVFKVFHFFTKYAFFIFFSQNPSQFNNTQKIITTETNCTRTGKMMMNEGKAAATNESGILQK